MPIINLVIWWVAQTHQKLVYSNRPIRLIAKGLFTSILFLFCRADRTMTGHVLGHPSTRAKGLVPERNLSSVVVGVARVLMHCAMIEGACRQPQVITNTSFYFREAARNCLMECPETLQAKQAISLVAFKSLPRLIRLAHHFWQINKAFVAFHNVVSGLIYFWSVVDLYNITRIAQLNKAPLNCVLPSRLKLNETKCEYQSSRRE